MGNKVKVIEDKKTFLITILILILVCVSIANYPWFYPSPPLKSISKKEIVNLVENAGDDIVFIETEEFYWFISDGPNFGNSIFNSLEINGWSREGYDIFKYKNNGIATGYDRIYKKNGVTLTIEVFFWVNGYQFAKTSRDTDVDIEEFLSPPFKF